MKVLITGVNGFVGKYLTDELRASGDCVHGTDILDKGFSPFTACDLTDENSARALIESVRPEAIYHLAGQSNVGISWKNPALTFRVNVIGTINLLEAVRAVCPKTKILIIGSSDQYGVIRPEDCPVDEQKALSPHSPYAISKNTQEEIARLYAERYGLDVVMTRSFNHIGPGQGLGFVVADFASAIVQVERGEKKNISVGNLSALRDFSDVRDVVRAYRLLVEHGRRGDVYNVGSGCAISIQSVLDHLISLANVPVAVEIDPEKLRPSDVPIIQCDSAKLQRETSWSPERDVRDTLAEILNYFRNLKA